MFSLGLVISLGSIKVLFFLRSFIGSQLLIWLHYNISGWCSAWSVGFSMVPLLCLRVDYCRLLINPKFHLNQQREASLSFLSNLVSMNLNESELYLAWSALSKDLNGAFGLCGFRWLKRVAKRPRYLWLLSPTKQAILGGFSKCSAGKLPPLMATALLILTDLHGWHIIKSLDLTWLSENGSPCLSNSQATK